MVKKYTDEIKQWVDQMNDEQAVEASEKFIDKPVSMVLLNRELKINIIISLIFGIFAVSIMGSIITLFMGNLSASSTMIAIAPLGVIAFIIDRRAMNYTERLLRLKKIQIQK